MDGKATGNNQSEDLTHYSQLNEKRMNRLDKTIMIPEENIMKLLKIRKEFIWLVISEGWCGDSAQILPVLNKMAIISPAIELRVVFRDENESLMNMFLTHGSRSIPKVILVDSLTKEVYGSWGPRPAGAMNLISSYIAQYGSLDETAKTELQLWYLHDKGLSTQSEILALMENLEQKNPRTS